jgi:ligand-binding sensor domain-containing protein
MKIIKIYLLYILYFILLNQSNSIHAQTEFLIYTPSNSDLSCNATPILVDDIGNIMFGSSCGLIKFNYSTSTWGVNDTSNTEIPFNNIENMAIDRQGRIWITSFFNGLICYYDSQWIIYNTSNSQIPSNRIYEIALDINDHLWLATDGGGLAKFDYENWTIFNKSNSDLKSNIIYTIAIDEHNIKWIGTRDGGLNVFDDNSWQVFNTSNSSLPNNTITAIAFDNDGTKWLGMFSGENLCGLVQFNDTEFIQYAPLDMPVIAVYSIAVDKKGTKWIGTVTRGLLKFDNQICKEYNPSNSNLDSYEISGIVIDSNDNVWMGTLDGVAVLRDECVGIKISDCAYVYYNYELYNNYPNPFNPITIFKYQLPKAGNVILKIYNIVGQEIVTLVNNHQTAGNHQIQWNAQRLPSGIYYYKLQAGNFSETKKLLLQN